MHKLSMHNMELFVENHLKPSYLGERMVILDVGSQDINGGYKILFEKYKAWTYKGMDITPGANVDIVIKDMYNWKEIEDNSYDVVICGQVFEHVEYPWLTIKEIKRVLVQGGYTCIIAPSSGFEHQYPVDCYRYFPDGFRALAKWAGLTVLDVYNCWDAPDMDGEPNFWKDSVLIAQKP